ncbi:hypothetical protein CRE_23184 [Caenorhabditis remanei]|uniref:Uncharacterized protein n=1 Tax=Caenorhabditis remanei TaxID=31234 RepID=E3NKH8_CAERE|nr:hypothetical protein CRE_23184 [Caenorhabditis remanei]
MKLLSFLPLLLTLFRIATPTYFKANGTLTCDLQQAWCYYIQMTEVDNFRVTDDKVAFSGVHCVHGRDANYEIAGWQLVDGFRNYYFEIELSVTHNCSCPRNKRKVTREVAFVSVYKWRVDYNWNANLTQSGDFVDDYW